MSDKKEVDAQCYCASCVSRTTESYRLNAHCSNCSGEFVLRLRKGDKPSRSRGCVYCGVSGSVHTTGLAS